MFPKQMHKQFCLFLFQGRVRGSGVKNFLAMVVTFRELVLPEASRDASCVTSSSHPMHVQPFSEVWRPGRPSGREMGFPRPQEHCADVLEF